MTSRKLGRNWLGTTAGWSSTGHWIRLQLQDPAKQQVVQGNLDMLAEAKSEIDNYGPNPGLIGTEVDASSGRAIQLLQAAGIAELGTFMLAFKHWKLRVYRAVWNAVQQLWTSERWIRVNDDEGMAQFVQVNGWQLDPKTGHPTVINQLAALDVDIIIEEGPDTINTMADTFDTLAGDRQAGRSGAAGGDHRAVGSAVERPRSASWATCSRASRIRRRSRRSSSGWRRRPRSLKRSSPRSCSTKPTPRRPWRTPTRPLRGGQQVDTQADIAKARLDVAKAMEIEQRVAAPPQDTPEPGLFALNVAKAQRDAAGAERERAAATKDAVRTDNLMRYGAEEPARRSRSLSRPEGQRSGSLETHRIL